MKTSAHSLLDSNAIVKLQERISRDVLPVDHLYHALCDRLLSRLDVIRMNPTTILNMSWHTQHSEMQLKKRYPNATIMNVQHFSDLNLLTDLSFDLVISHFSLLHENESILLLHAFSRLLRDEGLLLLSSLGPDSFLELRDSFSVVDHHRHVHSFLDMHQVGDWMKELHFSDPVMDREDITLAYDDVNLFFDDLKKCGAVNVMQLRQRGLLSKNKWKKMLLHYEQFKKDNYFPVTLEMIYGHGWKVSIKNDVDSIDEIMISVDSIKRNI